MAWIVHGALLLCLCCSSVLAGGTVAFDAEQLKACYQQPEDGSSSLTFDEYMTGLPSRLHLHSVLESPPAKAPESVLTVVTALNAARLDTLTAQCQSWPGLLVAALYAPLVRPVSPTGAKSGKPGVTSEESAQLKELQGKAQQTIKEAQTGPSACRLRVILLYEFVENQFMAALIPINALRNVALLGATTPLVAMVDVDLLISVQLGQQLVTGQPDIVRTRSEQLLLKCQKEHVAMVMPAFQTPKNRSINGYPQGEELQRSIELVQKLVEGDKSGVHKAMRNGDVIKFASQQFSIGHRRTDFPKWFETTVSYNIEFVPQFEPWYIVDRLHTPFYDVNFRGYGRNKQQQAAHASSVGMAFWVHPDVFLIHMPHDKSEAQKDHDATWVNVKARQAARLSGTGSTRLGRAGRASRKLRADTPQDSDDAPDQAAAPDAMPQGLQHVRRVDKLFRKFVRQMVPQEYKTLLDPASLDCLSKLPWWKGSSIAGWSTVEPNQ